TVASTPPACSTTASATPAGDGASSISSAATASAASALAASDIPRARVIVGGRGRGRKLQIAKHLAAVLVVDAGAIDHLDPAVAQRRAGAGAHLRLDARQ